MRMVLKVYDETLKNMSKPAATLRKLLSSVFITLIYCCICIGFSLIDLLHKQTMISTTIQTSDICGRGTSTISGHRVKCAIINSLNASRCDLICIALFVFL